MIDLISDYVKELQAKLSDLSIDSNANFFIEPTTQMKMDYTRISILPFSYGQTSRKPEVRGEKVLSWHKGSFELTFHYMQKNKGFAEKIQDATISGLGKWENGHHFYTNDMIFRTMLNMWGTSIMSLAKVIYYEWVRLTPAYKFPIATGAGFEGIKVN